MPKRFHALGPNRSAVAAAVFSRSIGILDPVSFEIPQAVLHVILADMIIHELEAGNRNITQMTERCVEEMMVQLAGPPPVEAEMSEQRTC